MPGRLHEVVYEDQFLQDLYSLQANPKIADEFILGAEWILSREQKYGTRITKDSDIWFYPIVDIPNMPSLALFYTFNDRSIYFLSIKAFPA